MSDIVFIIIWVSILANWGYLHIRFCNELKSHEPELYKANSDWSPLKYATGSACFDFALSGGHKSSEHKSVVLAGNKLVKAYEAKFKFIGYGFFLSSIWFSVSLFLWG